MIYNIYVGINKIICYVKQSVSFFFFNIFVVEMDIGFFSSFATI